MPICRGKLTCSKGTIPFFNRLLWVACLSERTCYLFAGGGTGGHLTPGLAVAAEILKRDPASRIVFVGSDRPLEKKLIAAAGHEHHALPVESSRTLLRNPVRFAWRSWRAIRMARKLLEREAPVAVIGLGGFASLPAVLAARNQGRPTISLESNAIPGRATRFLGRRVGAVCATFETTQQQLPAGARVVVTGNPVRSAIADLWHADRMDGNIVPQTLLILGGSQGAESLNEAVSEMFSRSLPALAGWRIVHQTGAGQHEAIARKYAAAGFTHVVEPFFDDLAPLYAGATLVVARAGGATLAELACAGCPAILLPYPHAADNHQLANAKVFESAGAAIIIEHDQSPSQTAVRLSAAVAELTQNSARRHAMRDAMRTLARPDAAMNVVDVIQSLMEALQ
jgi:UDP-N-acetylglucosamine--N-acetylmuramyl-(pentapeptide) pyrophosphoryl-undecaprenol N-acetylglucosamine transferase